MKCFPLIAVAVACFGLLADATDSVVTFNELQYHPPGPSQDGEWIELRNEMAVDVDLSGWRVGGGIEYLFPEDTLIPGGGFVVVARTPRAGQLGPYEGQLSNGGEALTLRDRAGRLMDEMDYGDGGGWPVAADGSGATLSKLRAGLLSSRSVSWVASLERGGTPGAENFPDPALPNPPPGPVFLEVAPGGQSGFFVEVGQAGAGDLDLTGAFLLIDQDSPVVVPLPAVTLMAGQSLTLTEEDLGVIPADGDRLFLLRQDGTSPSDARAVTGRLRGRSPDHGAAWLFPEVPTPGRANLFEFETEIVINEICYNPPWSDPVPSAEATVETFELIDREAVWRYNESGDDLGSDWATEFHPVGGNWAAGPGGLAFDSGLTFPVGTTLTNPLSNSPRVVTYYFETDFELTEAQVAGVLAMSIDHAVDDGAVFYLNGVEVERVRMPAGPITASTLASTGLGNAEFRGPVEVAIPPGAVRAGTNRFSVEVHQNSTGSNDVAFGLELFFEIETDPGRPRQPAQPSDEQWIELFNRGEEAVDLSGWDFGEGIDYEFPFGTILAPGEFLVVARDPAALASKHPGVAIVGPFAGSLSRGGETLTLRDDHRNPVDTLRYFDGGRWPSRADAGGSTLELRDPWADNSLPSAWAASDEVARTSWQEVRYRGQASASKVGPDNQWRDFVFGLHEAGEVLIDDLEVVEDPDGSAVSLLSDGSFESGNTEAWRFLGNHREAEIVPDPDGGGNVLRLRATGTTGHMHNHVETTLANGRSVVNGREYEISYRARWLGGDNQLHTRLYFNRLPRTTRLRRPEILGTPGAANSSLVENLGPTWHSLSHSPAVPAPGETVTVKVSLRDPDRVAGASLRYRVNGGPFSPPVAMTGTPGTEEWSVTLPGGPAGQVRQFYVEAVDGRGALSLAPAFGPDSRAMYQIDDGRAVNTGINNIRIIMDPTDRAELYERINVMSNGRIGCTVIDREEVVYYDAGVRIKGSQRARLAVNRIGFNLGFPADQLYRGVHRSVAIDRSEGQVVGQRELLFDLMATSSGGVPGEHNDLCYVISPDPAHTSAAILQMARFGSGYLDSQFDNGAEGTVYEYELVYYPTTADPNGYKYPQPDSVVGTNIRSLGDNPEDYRWTYLIKNNQENDNLEPMMEMSAMFDLPNAELHEVVEEVLDVDQWLRSMAYACAIGAGDSYFSNSRHNGQFYGRPDGKVLFFPHDNDFLFQTTRPIFQNTELSKLMTDPAKRRRYLGHLEDICSTVYNQSWMSRWAAHFDQLVPGASVFGDDLSYIGQRSNYILGQVSTQVAPVTFAITSNGGNPFESPESPVVIEGTGWVDIDEIRLAGSDGPLPIRWTSTDDWEVSVALSPGENVIKLAAYDFSGELVGGDTIIVTATGSSVLPSADNLVISEIFYHPDALSQGSEYLEFMNISETQTLDLTGVRLSDGVDFVFPAGILLEPGGRILVVQSGGGFESRFGRGLPVAGQFSNQLANGGERLTLHGADGSLIRSFVYSDDAPWPSLPDGGGASLVLVASRSNPDHTLAVNWRASVRAGGSPGGAGDLEDDYQSWKAVFGNPGDDEDPDGDGWTVQEEFLLGGSPLVRDELAPDFEVDRAGGFVIGTVTVRAGAGVAAVLESASDLSQWQPEVSAIFLGSERRIEGLVAVDRLTFAVPLGLGERYFRFSTGAGQ